MKRWFEELSRKMSIWMYGRYGNDEFNMFMSIAALVCLFLSPLINPLASVGLFFIIYSTFRTYSKNIESRRKEFSAYWQIKMYIKRYFAIKKYIFEYRKIYKYYRCPKCKASLRVPKGKGKIEITCVKCGHKFRKKT